MANKVKLTLIKSNTDKVSRNFNLKSAKDSWNGVMFYGPSIGKSFSFFRDDDEYMHTSTVQNIQYVDLNTYEITTRNSVYRLDVGEKQEPS
jgi:hypothetical protein